MSRIKGTNSKPELLVRKYLFSKGFRFRLHDKKLPGKPDITLPKYRTVIFINGCFWHGHENCKYFSIPKTRTEWWTEKISNNKINDVKSSAKLIELSWKVITVYTCDLKPKKITETLSEIIHLITSDFNNRQRQ